MRLTSFTDYGLRALMRLAGEPGRVFTTDEIAREFQISRNHLVKVVRELGEAGFVVTHRGVGGAASGGVHLCGQAAELAEELGVVRVVILEQAESPADEVFIAGQGLGKPQLGAHQIHEVVLEGRGVAFLDGGLNGSLVADQR
ncbi:MAG: Rrf2 family transcriptional regulator, partial [Anaerolineae bacterium]|nr:Rrf2 family transcriptional regulator [Anaerolineae bacterium]